MMLITVVEEGTASITKQRNICFLAVCLEDRDTRAWIFGIKYDQKYVCLYMSKNGLFKSINIVCTDSVMYFLYAINEFAQSTYITDFISYEGYEGVFSRNITFLLR